MLFYVVLDERRQGIVTDGGIALGDSNVAVLAFADDLILLPDAADGLPASLRVCERFFVDRLMGITTRKSMSLSIVRAHDRQVFHSSCHPSGRKEKQ